MVNLLLGSMIVKTNKIVGPGNLHEIFKEVREYRRPTLEFQDSDTLRGVNRAVNARYRYRRDRQRDVWQTPSETKAFGGGDCEDLAIMKMAELHGHMVMLNRMFIVVGMLPSGQGHAVLAVKDGDSYTILDNLRNDPYPEAEGELTAPGYAICNEQNYLLLGIKRRDS